MRSPHLRQYNWPGNFRELRNLVERVLILNPEPARSEGTRSTRGNGHPEESPTLVEAREA